MLKKKNPGTKAVEKKSFRGREIQAKQA